MNDDTYYIDTKSFLVKVRVTEIEFYRAIHWARINCDGKWNCNQNGYWNIIDLCDHKKMYYFWFEDDRDAAKFTLFWC